MLYFICELLVFPMLHNSRVECSQQRRHAISLVNRALFTGIFVSLSFLCCQCKGGNLLDDVNSSSHLVCGRNAAFIFLVMNGVDVEDNAFKQITLGSEGVSMLQLRDFFQDHGIATQVRKFRSDEITNMPLPAIWRSHDHEVHHYFIVYKTSDSGIYAIDGTTGREVRFKTSRVDDFFTGYAIVPDHPLFGSGLRDIRLSFGLCAFNMALVGILVRQKYRRNSRKKGTDHPRQLA